jgi:hypothetical protein
MAGAGGVPAWPGANVPAAATYQQPSPEIAGPEKPIGLQGGGIAGKERRAEEQDDEEIYRRALRRSFRPVPGPQFDPFFVPDISEPATLTTPGTNYFDPQYSKSDYVMLAQGGGIAPMLPMMPPPRPGSTDTVPAVLTPGEMVLTTQQQRAVQPIPGKAKRLRPEQRAALKRNRSRGY